MSTQPAGPVLRDYQTQAIADLRRAYARGARGVFLVAATGSGKTVIFSQICAQAAAKARRVLVLVHRVELVGQAAEKLAALGLDVGIVAASQREMVRSGVLEAEHVRPRPDAPVQVAMVQSLVRRTVDLAPDLIIVDEAHHARSTTYETILTRWPDAYRLFVSATPWRLDGRGFAAWCQAMVTCPPVGELMARGYLVPAHTYSYPSPDMSGVQIRAGDYAQDEAALRFDVPELRGDVVSHYQRLGAGRRGVVFAASVTHSRALRDEFRRSGIEAEHIDGETPPDERRRSLGARVVCNYGILLEGWDSPPVSYVAVVRATASFSLWIQMAGRGLRPYEGKGECILADHGGNADRHGLIDDVQAWSLKDRPKKPGVAPVKTCPDCKACVPAACMTCPRCGHEFEVARVERKVEPGELARFVRPLRAEQPRRCPPQYRGREQAWQMYEARRVQRGYKPGWVWHMMEGC